jgi:haloacetate dehalogenase
MRCGLAVPGQRWPRCSSQASSRWRGQVAADPVFYLHRLLGSSGSRLDAYEPEALAAYEKAFSDPEVRHATIEDYRAGASIDLEHDAEEKKITAPTLVLWDEKGIVGHNPEGPIDVWHSRAADPALVTGRAVPDAGHFLVEENLPATLAALRDFLS